MEVQGCNAGGNASTAIRPVLFVLSDQAEPVPYVYSTVSKNDFHRLDIHSKS